MSNTSALRKEVEASQSDLDEQLASGASTIESRRKLKEAQTNLQTAEQAESKTAAKTEAKVQTERQREAAKLVDEATTELNASLQKLAHVEVPRARLPIHLGVNILSAREKLDTDTESSRAYHTRISQLREQQHALESRRNEIVSRRAAGQGNDKKDGESLALIQADQEGLAQMIDREIDNGDAVDTTRSEPLVNEALQGFERAFRAEQIRVLRELTGQLEALLITAAQALSSAPGVLAKDRYQPNPVIRKASQEGLL